MIKLAVNRHPVIGWRPSDAVTCNWVCQHGPEKQVGRQTTLQTSTLVLASPNDHRKGCRHAQQILAQLQASIPSSKFCFQHADPHPSRALCMQAMHSMLPLFAAL
eukprot:1159897-Pelagomonas_calceolata.AAC.8